MEFALFVSCIKNIKNVLYFALVSNLFPNFVAQTALNSSFVAESVVGRHDKKAFIRADS